MIRIFKREKLQDVEVRKDITAINLKMAQKDLTKYIDKSIFCSNPIKIQ